MKKTQIIIITIALILTLGCIGTFSVLYFATDTFKSDKELFYKYASQIDLKEFFDLESYNTYLQRLKIEGHASEGELTVEFAESEETVSESIKYNGYTDPVNKTANYDISINKDNETLLDMNYLKQQDIYGVWFKEVVSQYVAFDNNNLKEFASKIGIEDTRYIPNKIEIPEAIKNINYEELNAILNSYLNIAMKQIPEDNYSKIKKEEISLGDETVEVDGYQVKLKVKDVQKILTKVLENAKNDEQIYNLLNSEDITFEDYQAVIDEMLLEISGEISKEDNIEVITISVYKQGKDTVKLVINTPKDEVGEIEFSIEKRLESMNFKFDVIRYAENEIRSESIIEINKSKNKKEQENVIIDVKFEVYGEETGGIAINIERKQELTSDNVIFNMFINMHGGYENLTIEFENITNFLGVPKEGKFEQGNHLVINGLTPEQLTNLFTNLGNMLSEKLKDEMFVTLITNLTTVNNQIIENAQQNMQDTQNALEQESALNSGMLEVNGQMYNNVDEYGYGL